MMKSKLTASIFAFLLMAVSAVITANADAYVAYYDKDSRIIDVKTIQRDCTDADLNEYANFYAPNDSVSGKIFKFADGCEKPIQLKSLREETGCLTRKKRRM